MVGRTSEPGRGPESPSSVSCRRRPGPGALLPALPRRCPAPPAGLPRPSWPRLGKLLMKVLSMTYSVSTVLHVCHLERSAGESCKPCWRVIISTSLTLCVVRSMTGWQRPWGPPLLLTRGLQLWAPWGPPRDAGPPGAPLPPPRLSQHRGFLATALKWYAISLLSEPLSCTRSRRRWGIAGVSCGFSERGARPQG